MSEIRALVNDYKEYIIANNPNVWANSIRQEFLIIDGDSVRTSNVPFALDNAKFALVLFHYTYTVVTQNNNNFFALFINDEGYAEDYVEIDKWRFEFDKPVTALYRTQSKNLIISKGNLKLKVKVNMVNVAKGFERMWELYAKARECSSQLELDLLKDLYVQKQDLDSVNNKNYHLCYQNRLLEENVKAYEGLLGRISNLVNCHKNM